MGELLDEFSFLSFEESDKTIDNVSKQNVEQVSNFIKLSNKFPDRTYQGMLVKNIADCMSIESTDAMNWEHTVFTLDFELLRGIGATKLKEFTIPPCIEEVRTIDINSDQFIFNQSIKNNIKRLSIPKSVLLIHNNTFSYFKNLETIKFEEGSRLLAIGSKAFACCEKLKTLDLRTCKELQDLPSKMLHNSSLEYLYLNGNIREIAPDCISEANVENIVVNDINYKANEFIERLKNNNYKAFWTFSDITYED